MTEQVHPIDVAESVIQDCGGQSDKDGNFLLATIGDLPYDILVNYHKETKRLFLSCGYPIQEQFQHLELVRMLLCCLLMHVNGEIFLKGYSAGHFHFDEADMSLLFLQTICLDGVPEKFIAAQVDRFLTDALDMYTDFSPLLAYLAEKQQYPPDQLIELACGDIARGYEN